jgi:hypothetical protein
VLLFYPFAISNTKGRKIMKNQIKSVVALLLCVLSIFCLVACADKVDAVGVWEDATYRSDKEFGEGSKTVQVEVKVEEQSVTFTIHTDAKTLGEALLAHKLIEGEDGPYGLYVKKVNGMTADYDVNQRYWSFSKNGTNLMTGVDMEPVEDGAHYEITYAK